MVWAKKVAVFTPPRRLAYVLTTLLKWFRDAEFCAWLAPPDLLTR
jgi:hypothetical protein